MNSTGLWKHVNYCLKLIKKQPHLSINLLWKEIKTKYDDFDISQAHLFDVIRDNNITRKRTRQRHYPITRYGKPIYYKKEMNIFYHCVDKYSINKIMCIDETSINAQMPFNYSRCELGERCVSKTKDNKVFKKFTLVCAITSKGVIEWTLYENGGMTAIRMIEFINKFINNKFKKYLIIMDNGGAHKHKDIKTSVEKSQNKLLYSVPYRPKTNAIESWFNQFKYYYKLDNKSISFIDLEKKCIKFN